MLGRIRQGREALIGAFVCSLHDLWEHFVGLAEELDKLAIDVIEAVLQRMEQQQIFHRCQRDTIQMRQDQINGLEGSRAQCSELKQSPYHGGQVIIVLLDYLGAVLSHLLHLGLASQIYLQDLRKEVCPFLSK